VPTLYGRDVRVRRDQLVLGAVAAAILLAIVAFAASSGGVKSAPPTPTPTATPASERDLFGGSLEPRVRYRTRSFAPRLSFVAGDTEWLVQDATQPEHLVVERRLRTNRPGSELPSRAAVVFSRVFQVTDPKEGRLLNVNSLYPWLRQHPDLVVGRAEPVTVAGREGLRFDETVRFTKPAVSASACRMRLLVCTLIAPNRFYENGTRMHTYVLPMPAENPLVIDILAQTKRDLDEVEVPAMELLRTLTISFR
jgi:hypothetical protein